MRAADYTHQQNFMPPPMRRQEVASTRELLRQLPGTLSLLWAAGRFTTLLWASLTLVLSLTPAAAAYTGKLIIDAVVAHQPVLKLILLQLGIMFAQVMVQRTNALVAELIRSKLGNLINERILAKALSLELRHFEDPALYDKLQNARREASSRPLSLASSALTAMSQVVTLISFAALLWSIAWWAVFVLLACALPSFFIEARLSFAAYKLYSWRAPEGRRLNYLEWILTRDSHVKEVKLYGLGDFILGRYRELFDRFFKEDRALSTRRFKLGLFTSGLGLAALYGCYSFAAVRASAGELSVGDLTMAFSVLQAGQGAFSGMLLSVAGMHQDALFMSNLFAYLSVEAAGEKAIVQPAATLPKGPHTLELRGVSFRYPGKEAWALRDISLVLQPGQKLGLVGENGAGKSTLIKLLLRLYEPTEGQILYGGVDIRALDPADLRSRFGAVFQDFVRYQFSAGENIGLGELPKLQDRPAIEQAAKAGGADEVVAGLPRGYETVLGTWFDDAAEVSAGQWQKLAVARAFMRESPEMLILDEPTASIDALAEAQLFERFARLSAKASAIIISHRFSTVRLADRIAVLEGGTLTELGSHEELVAKGGQYATLFALQARGYQ